MYFITKKRNKKIIVKGFILPFTMLIATLVLFVTTGALALLTKQQYFSKVYKQTQAAYYAADDAVSCAITIDDTYVSNDGLGIFPSSSTTPAGLEDLSAPYDYIDSVISYINTKRQAEIPPLTPDLTKDGITCGQSQIFAEGGNPNFNPHFTITDYNYAYYFTNPLTSLPDKEYGVTSSFNMQMDLGLDPEDTLGTRHLYRCAKVTVSKTASFRQVIAQGYSSCEGTGNAIERAVVNTTIIQ
jgi:hypothetical protein